MQSAEAATPAPTYGDVRELEQALHRPVLAERPVEDRQDDVDGAERRERARRRPERAASPPDRRLGPELAACRAVAERPAAVAADRDVDDS